MINLSLGTFPHLKQLKDEGKGPRLLYWLPTSELNPTEVQKGMEPGLMPHPLVVDHGTTLDGSLARRL